MNILSLGAGVQSTALLMLSAEGRLPKLDAAIFADTGWEPAAVYEHLDRLDREVAKPAGIPIYRVSNGNIRTDPFDPDRWFGTMPLFIQNPDGTKGMQMRQCTAGYKVAPIKAKIRELLGARPKTNGRPGSPPKGAAVDQWIGISTDEFHRAKDSDVKYMVNRFPLLDIDWSRNDCITYLADRGWGSTPKSACIGCPFHGNQAWRDLRDNSPAEWDDAVEFDAAIRNGSAKANATGTPLRGQAFLHRSLLPLSEAPIDVVTRKEARGDQLTFTCSPFSCEGDESATAGELGWTVIPTEETCECGAVGIDDECQYPCGAAR